MRFSVLLASALLIAAPASTQAPVVQTIDLYSYGYNPPVIRLAAGRPVTLTFVNRAGKGHDFTAPSFFAHSRIVSGPVHEGEIELMAGQVASVTLVPTAGTYHAHCSHFFHKQLGMRATILVY